MTLPLRVLNGREKLHQLLAENDCAHTEQNKKVKNSCPVASDLQLAGRRLALEDRAAPGTRPICNAAATSSQRRQDFAEANCSAGDELRNCSQDVYCPKLDAQCELRSCHGEVQSVAIVTGRLIALNVEFFRRARYPTRRQTESHRAPRYQVRFQIEDEPMQEAVVDPNPPSH
ncbi:MAG TPA: hypothetical protein VJU59_35670, partial [Paraburkholderia sp.]|uniref:hypothetical protein n=1 Tax=Paraburkholderia sp. TaxID=1926495 RepID=UPI002B844A02|nr:hypothetical protein [Paraburkholderia sp.]